MGAASNLKQVAGLIHSKLAGRGDPTSNTLASLIPRKLAGRGDPTSSTWPA